MGWKPVPRISMVTGLKNRLRRWVRGAQRGGCFPVVLPHHRLESHGIEVQGAGRRELSDPQVRALAMCDGTRTAADVARACGVRRSWLVHAQDEGWLILWRAAVPREPAKLAGSPQAIIVSPHPDDAALSCGGRMLAGQATLVINVFSRTAWWRFPRTEGDLEK